MSSNRKLGMDILRCFYLPYGIDFPGGPSRRFSNGKTTMQLVSLHFLNWLINFAWQHFSWNIYSFASSMVLKLDSHANTYNDHQFIIVKDIIIVSQWHQNGSKICCSSSLLLNLSINCNYKHLNICIHNFLLDDKLYYAKIWQ